MESTMNGIPALVGGWRSREPVAPDPEPLVSIIIPVWNGEKTLRAAIDSVIKQSMASIELIVVDGGSSDGTLDVLRSYGDRIALWKSSKDRGIYDAMNSGIDQARGTWIYFLGADDALFSSDVVQVMLENIEEDVALVCGNIKYDDGRMFKSSLGLKTHFINTVHHQAAFYRRTLFDGFRYDLALRVASDYEMNYRVKKERKPYVYRDVTVALCGAAGTSHRTSEWANYRESFSIRSRYVNPLFNLFFYSVGILNVLRRKVIGKGSHG